MQSQFVDLNVTNLTHATCLHSVHSCARVGSYNLSSAINATNVNCTNELSDAVSFIC